MCIVCVYIYIYISFSLPRSQAAKSGVAPWCGAQSTYSTPILLIYTIALYSIYIYIYSIIIIYQHIVLIVAYIVSL